MGSTWGRVNGEAIRRHLEEHYLAPARAAGLAASELAARSEAFVRIAQRLAPHWLEEAAAIAAAAGVDGGLCLGFAANVYRRLFLAPECTSYATRFEHNAGQAILFHKTRDNARRAQCAFLLASAVPGLHRFLAVSDASVLAAMMMVNDQGLAGSADTGGLPARSAAFPVHLGQSGVPLGLLDGRAHDLAERSHAPAEALEPLEQAMHRSAEELVGQLRAGGPTAPIAARLDRWCQGQAGRVTAELERWASGPGPTRRG